MGLAQSQSCELGALMRSPDGENQGMRLRCRRSTCMSCGPTRVAQLQEDVRHVFFDEDGQARPVWWMAEKLPSPEARGKLLKRLRNVVARQHPEARFFWVQYDAEHIEVFATHDLTLRAWGAQPEIRAMERQGGQAWDFFVDTYGHGWLERGANFPLHDAKALRPQPRGFTRIATTGVKVMAEAVELAREARGLERDLRPLSVMAVPDDLTAEELEELIPAAKNRLIKAEAGMTEAKAAKLRLVVNNPSPRTVTAAGEQVVALFAEKLRTSVAWELAVDRLIGRISA